MALLIQTIHSGKQGSVLMTRTSLSASDSIPYNSGTHQKLKLDNNTGSPIVVTIVGASATTISPVGFGGTINVSGGYQITVPSNSTHIVDLDTISAYLSGNITINGGTGIVAVLYV